jgi:hypothetical protein
MTGTSDRVESCSWLGRRVGTTSWRMAKRACTNGGKCARPSSREGEWREPATVAVLRAVDPMRGAGYWGVPVEHREESDKRARPRQAEDLPRWEATRIAMIKYGWDAEIAGWKVGMEQGRRAEEMAGMENRADLRRRA